MNEKKIISQSIALNMLIVVAIAEPGSAANIRASQGLINLSETLEYKPPNDGAPGDRCAKNGITPCDDPSPDPKLRVEMSQNYQNYRIPNN